MNNRREFLAASVYSLAAIGIVVPGESKAQTALAETGPQAAALGYKLDTAQVDKKKYPKHTTEQKCANCQLYQSKSANDGGCAIFAGKTVPAAAWCSAYQKKA
jgi:hypothetical protein